MAVLRKLAVFVLLALMACQEGSGEDWLGACAAAHIAVRNRLKAPAGADFSSCSENTAKRQPDGTWAVGGYVDAQNSFGAKLRNVFLVRLTFDSTRDPHWAPVSVELEPR
jgi:hypothetical protein